MCKPWYLRCFAASVIKAATIFRMIALAFTHFQNLELYKKIYRAIVPGGTLMIRDHIMEESRTMPPAGAVFAINMLAATDGGDTYTFREIQSALESAGYIDIRQIRQGENMDGIVTARKPA